MIFASTISQSSFGPMPAIVLGAIGIVLLFVGGYRLRETTLLAPVAWAVIAIGLLTCSCVYAALPAGEPATTEWNEALSTYSYLRYAAAALVIAPTLAQLGAKSPQNGAWQFIVVTLVVVLLLPAGQGWAYGDEAPIVHGLIRWLLAAHVFLGVGNYLFTRYGASAILLGVGESAIIAEYLPLGSREASPRRELFGLACLIAAIAMAFVSNRIRAPLKPGVAKLWTDFRDAFGAVWTLRIAERLNVSARLHHWPVDFSWAGINAVGRDDDAAERPDLAGLTPELQHRIERELRSYLRRFVSHDWISRRLPHDSAPNSAQVAAESETRR